MNLILTPNAIRNTTLRTPSGQALYRVSTPWSWGTRTTTISRVVPNSPVSGPNHSHKHSDNNNSDNINEDIRSEVDMQDRWEDVAQIEWHHFARSRVRFVGAGTEMSAGAYIPSKGILLRQRVFTAPDGRSYRWTLGLCVCTLELDDGSHTIVAQNYRSDAGLLPGQRAHPAYLKIYPEGAHIVDAIVVTFVYVERTRRHRRKRHM